MKLRYESPACHNQACLDLKPISVPVKQAGQRGGVGGGIVQRVKGNGEEFVDTHKHSCLIGRIKFNILTARDSQNIHLPASGGMIRGARRGGGCRSHRNTHLPG